MATKMEGAELAAVKQTVRVKADAQHAFRVFTHEFDSWWPRGYHIGKSPLKRAIIEERAGGRCYSEQQDGTDCEWGTVLAWDPPRSFRFAWQIDADWTYQPDVARSSEVEVTFIPQPDGYTDVVLEHRHFDRHGTGGATMRATVNSEGGWGTLLQLYVAQLEGRAPAVAPRMTT
ncbi:MAG TPA: SRPBCC family protein [Gemmatimonadaceae bacterium]